MIVKMLLIAIVQRYSGCRDLLSFPTTTLFRSEELADAGGRQAALGEPERGAQPRTSRSDDDHVVAVIDELVRAHGAAPSATLRTATTPAPASSTCANMRRTSVTVRAGAP